MTELKTLQHQIRELTNPDSEDLARGYKRSRSSNCGEGTSHDNADSEGTEEEDGGARRSRARGGGRRSKGRGRRQ